MAEYELGMALREAYNNAKRNEIAMSVHLFGIEHGEEILANHYNIPVFNLRNNYSVV